VAAPPAPGPPGLDRFVRAHTAPAAPPLLPELTLYLSRAEPTLLWEQTERDTRDPDRPPPFWAYPWAGGIALARYLLDHPDRVAGRVVLDLASGSGLVAIAAALAGAARVTASDIDPLAAAAIAVNAAANGVDITIWPGDLLSPEPDGVGLDGTGPDSAGPDSAGPDSAGPDGTGPDGAPSPGARPAADVVLAGDACYERRMAHRVLGFLDRATAAGASAMIGDPGRAYLRRDGLRELARYDVPAWPGLEDTEIKPTTVWELR
jgi:predicted nicotinamide N-methyase